MQFVNRFINGNVIIAVNLIINFFSPPLIKNLTAPFSSCLTSCVLRFSFTVFQALCEECECCSRSLAEIGVSVQEFGEQNPLLCKQLGDAVAKLTELQRHSLQQVQDRANRLKKVRCP